MDSFPDAEFPWPKRGQQLFVEGGNYSEFSHIGWGDRVTQLSAYTSGYKEAADALVNLAVSKADIATLDTVLFPVCFLYRQYLELVMKAIYLKCSPDSSEQKKAVLKKVGHCLPSTWARVKSLLRQDASPPELADLDVVEDYIDQFHRIDSSSFTFRYPFDKALQPMLPKEQRVNIVALKQRMDELEAFFGGAEGKMDYMRHLGDGEASELLSELY